MMRVIIFFLILSFKSFSQSITLGNINEIGKIHFLKETNELYLFEKDSISIIDLDNFERISKEKIIYPNENFLNVYEISSIQSEIHFVENHGGHVYKLKDAEFIRLDKSYTHRMQMGSTLFVQNDTIFKYGGYGFWSMRNFFTYFDTQTSEWGIVSPKGSKEIPEGSQLTTINISENDIFVYGGLKLNPIEPLEYLTNNQVWKFEMKNKSWKLLGDSKIDFNEFEFNFSYGSNQIFYGLDDDRMILVNPVNNEIKYFKKKKFHYGLNNKYSFFNNGVFYCILNPYGPDEYTLLKRDGDDFFGELISEEKLYYNNEKIYYSIGIFLVGLVFLFVYSQFNKVRHKRNKIILENDSLIYKGKILNFDKQSIRILNLLLNSEEEVFSKDIMKITENPSLNYGHNTRVLNKTIEEINFKLQSILECEEELISFKKSESDKRIKVYSIEKTHFFLKRIF